MTLATLLLALCAPLPFAKPVAPGVYSTPSSYVLTLYAASETHTHEGLPWRSGLFGRGGYERGILWRQDRHYVVIWCDDFPGKIHFHPNSLRRLHDGR